MMTRENDATLAEVVRKHVILTLASCGGNRTHAARILDISLRCLRDKLRGYESAGVYITPYDSHGPRRNLADRQHPKG
jgi:DNA-binding NtrC family response regulator